MISKEFSVADVACILADWKSKETLLECEDCGFPIKEGEYYCRVKLWDHYENYCNSCAKHQHQKTRVFAHKETVTEG